MRLAILFFTLLIAPIVQAASTVIIGTVSDASTGEPIPYATIRVLGTGQSTSCNEAGQYRLRLDPGQYEIKFSHVAHYSFVDTLVVGDSTFSLDVQLHPALIDVGQIKVYDRDYDEAQRIIAEAIAHKEEILAKIQQYSFDAYTKLVFRDTAKPDSTNILLITETQVTGYWKYPDKYKEIITARKQSANIDAENNLVAVGDILNFNKNRIDFGRYAFVSPTATDALDYYNYYIKDTTYVDGNRVFELEIEPRNDWTPLFVGTIGIADSTYDVVGVDVGFNKAFDNSILKEPHYRQVCAEFGRKFWMPTLLQFDGVVVLPIPGIPTFSFDYSASLHKFTLNTKFPDTTFNEFALEVAPEADNIDSTSWSENQLMPLTESELHGYFRIDSIKHAPRPLYKRALDIALRASFVAAFYPDMFHFNRVEGPYLGLSVPVSAPGSRWKADLKGGFAFGPNLWEHRVKVSYLLWKKRRVELFAIHHEEIRTRPTIISETNGNATGRALLNKSDPYNYYHEKGFSGAVQGRLLNHTTLGFGINDLEQLSEINHNEFSIFKNADKNRPNPAIIDGHLRSVSAVLRYDSRPLLNNKGRVLTSSEVVYTTVQAGVEYSRPDFLNSDFDYTRYSIKLFRRQRTFGWGLTSIYAYAGISDRTLPPQRFFTVDFGSQIVNGLTTLHTMSDSSFVGDRAAVIYATHDFGSRLFKASRLPLIKELPLTLDIHGGVFWTEFRNRKTALAQRAMNVSPNAYSEIGFGIGRLLPLGLVVNMTWQLSNHNTNKFALDLSRSLF
jgi:hypothetical protein